MRETLPTAAEGATAQALHEAVVLRIQEVERLFWELGGAIRQMHDGRLYAALGHPTFQSWLADPDVNLSVSQAYRLMTCDRAFSPLLNGSRDGKPALVTPDALAAIGVARAELVAPFVSADDPARAVEWLGKARALSVSDLKREVKDARRDTPLTDLQAWLAETGYHLSRVALKLTDGPDRAEALALADRLENGVLAMRARLEESR